MTDILHNPETGDLLCLKGDFVTGDATFQHQQDLLVAKEGEYKQFPATGIGLEGFLLDEDPTEMVRKIRTQFTKDGMNVQKIKRGIPGFDIKATYP